MLKHKPIILIAAIFLILFENIILIYNNAQNKTSVLGLRLNSRPVFFLSRPQIEEVIKQEVAKNQRLLKFIYQDQNFEINPNEIGSVNPTVVSNQLIEEGRKGSTLNKFIYQNLSLLGLKNKKLTGEVVQSKLTVKIAEIQTDINKEAEPIQPNFREDLNKTVPAKDGVEVNTDKLTVLIIDNIFNPPTDALHIPVMKTFTTHSEEELVSLRKQARELVQKPISITSGGLAFTLLPEDINALLKVAERPDPKDPKKLKLVLRLNDKLLNQKLGEFASKVEEVTNAEFDDHDARVAIYSLFYSNQRRSVQIPTGRNLKKVLGVETSGPKVAYLTFDDGPNSIYHPLILDILKSNNIKATFFLVGQNAQRDSGVAGQTASDGHKIGNHSLTHSFLPKLASNSILKELQSTSDILKPFNGNQDILFFRPPYGGVNLAVKQNAEKLNLKMFLWDVDPRDWSEPETQELVNRVVNNTYPGADILLHSNHLATVKALPKIIEALRNQGYSFEQLQ